jgi:hypothetical protein
MMNLTLRYFLILNLVVYLPKTVASSQYYSNWVQISKKGVMNVSKLAIIPSTSIA